MPSFRHHNQVTQENGRSVSVSDRTRLDGRSAVVVGGTKGIGRAVAERLAALGAAIVVNGRDADSVSDTSAASADVAERLIELCVGRHGTSTSSSTAQVSVKRPTRPS